MEIWKDIPTYEGIYQASSLGRIKRLTRKVETSWRDRPYLNNWYERVLKTQVREAWGGYVSATLTTPGLSKKGRKAWYVHRLVAMAFIPNPNNYPFVNHKNGIKTDNRPENLEWCTSSHNQRHAHALGLKNPPYGETNYLHKLTDEIVMHVRKIKKEGGSIRGLSAKYGVDRSTLWEAAVGKSWKHLPMPA